MGWVWWKYLKDWWKMVSCNNINIKLLKFFFDLLYFWRCCELFVSFWDLWMICRWVCFFWSARMLRGSFTVCFFCGVSFFRGFCLLGFSRCV